MLFTGHFDKMGIVVSDSEKRKLSAVLLFFMTNDLDLAGSQERTASNDTPLESMPGGNDYPGGDSHLKVIIIAQD